jgi:hypothetical protein
MTFIKSESIKNLAKALAVFNDKVSKVNKDAINPFFKSNYASLPNVLDIIKEPLKESGIVFSQIPVDSDGLITIIIHVESGEYIEGTYTMRPVKETPQERGSTITYQRRYALTAMLGLNVDDDDDGNNGTFGSDKKSLAPAPAHKPTIVTAPVPNQNEIFDYIRTKVGEFTKGSELRASMYDLLSEAKKKGLTDENMTVLKGKIETKANQLITTNTNG